jgi:GT2 family glycosyltransferase
VTSVSIIIVSFNARERLEDCLNSLTSHPPGTRHEIVVVDNASTDGSAAMVKSRWPQITVLEQSKNAGFAAGNNVGIRATDGTLVLLLNNDTVVPEGAVDRLVDRLLAYPDAAVAGPRLTDENGRAELSFGRMISPFNELRQKLTMLLYRRGVRWVARRIEQATQLEQEVDWVSGACLLVRRVDAVQAGLLDERYFLYTEDVDFCAAIRARGRRVIFTPAAHVVHVGGQSRATAADAMNVAYRKSHIAFYEKHHPRWAPVLRTYLRVKGQLPR